MLISGSNQKLKLFFFLKKFSFGASQLNKNRELIEFAFFMYNIAFVTFKSRLLLRLCALAPEVDMSNEIGFKYNKT